MMEKFKIYKHVNDVLIWDTGIRSAGYAENIIDVFFFQKGFGKDTFRLDIKAVVFYTTMHKLKAKDLKK